MRQVVRSANRICPEGEDVNISDEELSAMLADNPDLALANASRIPLKKIFMPLDFDLRASKKKSSMTEKAFEAKVKKLARDNGWMYYHTWRSYHSPAGFPDCVMVRPPKIIFAELKSQRGKLSPQQEEWITRLYCCRSKDIRVYTWRPSDWDKIVEILS